MGNIPYPSQVFLSDDDLRLSDRLSDFLVNLPVNYEKSL